ncbi:phosphoesterase PA-phosphatase related [Lachnoclostridium phytofermentans ISDg]|uniref:Phosphoesterase PA-phosphatase related n=2 Tax=Lachnoclostridium phytofermentans TaxID=66219 RepID=A9KJL2_LACP7|nr:phosphoesterase PA-phosphatase related [Lachnoclostridium phytofermentans ISDg]
MGGYMEFLYQLESIRNPFLSGIFRLFTLLGQEVVVLAVLCFFYWCYNKKLAYRISFGFFLSAILVQGLKITFRIPRPWIKDPLFKPVEDAINAATGYSFPSGHTQAATALYGTLALATKKRASKIMLFLVIAMVGLSRMYLGVHTPADVLTSFVITLATILLVYYFSNFELTKDKKVYLMIGIGVFAIALLIYCVTLYTNGTIELAYAADSCSAAAAGVGLAIGWYVESTYLNFNERACSNRMQVVKLLIGLTVTILLKEGLGFILGASITGKGVKYFLLVLWIMIGYPCIIKRFMNKA